MRTLLLILLLTGCAAGISKNPIDIECKGKGTISGIGAGALPNAWAVNADCGDGFSYRSGPPPNAK